MLDFLHHPFQPLESKTVYQGPRFNVCQLEVKGLSGKRIQRDMIYHPGAVTILPILDEKHVVMIKNERFAVGQTLLELPAGTLEPHEPPLETARRELIEETGYQCNQLDFLTKFYTSPGFCNELMFTYVAKDLTFVGQRLEDSEKITTVVMSWDKLKQAIHQGEILDGKTLTTLLFYLSRM